MKSINFTCINFNGSGYTKKFCQSLQLQNGRDVDFSILCTIVDNSTSAQDAREMEEYAKEYSWLNYIRAPKNLGYFGGLNHGLFTFHESDDDYVAICNNDLVFEPDFCSQLLTKNYRKDVMAVCPDVITEDGIHQNPHNLMQIGLLRRFQFDLFFSHYWLAKITSLVLRLMRPVKKSPLQPSTGCEIHMGVGACYVLTKEFFKNFKKLDYPHFLYAEEAYLTNQIHTARGILWFDPDLRVHHAESASLSKVPKRTAYEFGRTSYWGCRPFLLRKKPDVK